MEIQVSKIEDIIFKTDDEVENIDMTPFLGLMAVLVPMLLLTASFVTINSLGAKVPVLADAKAAIDKQKEENIKDKVGVHVSISKDNTVVISVKRGKSVVSNSRVPASVEKGLDIERIQKEVVSIKTKHPDIFQARVNPTEQVKYENIVAVMDIMRVAPATVEFPVKDIDTGQVFKTNIMFDDVTFGNIMGDEL